MYITKMMIIDVPDVTCISIYLTCVVSINQKTHLQTL